MRAKRLSTILVGFMLAASAVIVLHLNALSAAPSALWMRYSNLRRLTLLQSRRVPLHLLLAVRPWSRWTQTARTASPRTSRPTKPAATHAPRAPP